MAQLTLQSLQESGSFAGPPVKREIEWVNPEGESFKADVWVRRASYHTITDTWKQAAENQEHLAARIAAMTCKEDGSAIFRIEDILGSATHGPICDTLFFALITVVNDVNSGKKSPQKTSGLN
jgi:hypothetical protein